jgi:MATE family multidrug resistance protein
MIVPITKLFLVLYILVHSNAFHTGAGTLQIRTNIRPQFPQRHRLTAPLLHPSTHLALLSNNEHTHQNEELETSAAAASETPATILEELEGSNEEEENEENIDQQEELQNTGKAILSLAVPALAGLAIDPLMTLADTAFIGRSATNADALAGVGSAAALLTFSFYLFNFLCTVTTPLVSQRRSSGDASGAVEIGGQALSLAIILGTILSGVLIAFSQPLLEIMGTGNTGVDANGYATTFLTLRAIAAPAVFLISASTGILRGYLDTKSAFVILFGANVVNFLLDVILITWMDMGPKGAAIATTTAEWLCAIFFLLILAGKIPSVDGMLGSNQQAQVRRTENDEVNGDSQTAQLIQENNQDVDVRIGNAEMVIVTPTLKVPTKEAIQPLIVASSSVFVRSFMLQLSIAGAAAMAARSRGDDVSEAASASIAAHQIALQLWLLCSFICDALAAASQALVADGLGREDSNGVLSISKTIFAYSLGLGLFLAGALGLGDASGFLLNFFTEDVQVQAALGPLLVILIAAQPLNAFVFAADGVLQGASAFSYQAKSMVLSASVAVGSFYGLQYFDGAVETTSTLVHVWYALVTLQLMRGVTSLWKLADADGPIDLFSRGRG